jgi:hypothetical protein
VTRTAAAAVALALVVAASCTRGPTPRQRASEIAAARVAVEAAAEELGRSGLILAEMVDDVLVGGQPPVDARATLLGPTRTDALGDLEVAIAAAQQATLRGEGPDVAAARSIWMNVVTVARELRVQSEDDLAHADAVLEVDAALNVAVATWQQPGSRNEQVATLTATAATVRAVGDGLTDRVERPTCAHVWERRRQAAQAVVTGTEQLRDLVASGNGTAFDETRAALADDPYGLAVTELAVTDRQDAACWREHGGTTVQAALLRDALAALVTALDPDL